MARNTEAANAISTSDVYERITIRIVEQLEVGTRPWMQTWGGGGTPVRPLRHTGIAYRGINTVLLWMAAAEQEYSSPYWMTYKQAFELGAQVKKGEKSTLVVYANAIERKETNEAGEEIERRIPFMKGYSVFFADQIERLPEHYYAKPSALPENGNERIEAADRYFAHQAPTSAMAAARYSIIPTAISSRCRPLKPSCRPRRTQRRSGMNAFTGR